MSAEVLSGFPIPGTPEIVAEMNQIYAGYNSPESQVKGRIISPVAEAVLYCFDTKRTTDPDVNMKAANPEHGSRAATVLSLNVERQDFLTRWGNTIRSGGRQEPTSESLSDYLAELANEPNGGKDLYYMVHAYYEMSRAMANCDPRVAQYNNGFGREQGKTWESQIGVLRRIIVDTVTASRYRNIAELVDSMVPPKQTVQPSRVSVAAPPPLRAGTNVGAKLIGPSAQTKQPQPRPVQMAPQVPVANPKPQPQVKPEPGVWGKIGTNLRKINPFGRKRVPATPPARPIVPQLAPVTPPAPSQEVRTPSPIDAICSRAAIVLRDIETWRNGEDEGHLAAAVGSQAEDLMRMTNEDLTDPNRLGDVPVLPLGVPVLRIGDIHARPEVIPEALYTTGVSLLKRNNPSGIRLEDREAVIRHVKEEIYRGRLCVVQEGDIAHREDAKNWENIMSEDNSRKKIGVCGEFADYASCLAEMNELKAIARQGGHGVNVQVLLGNHDEVGTNRTYAKMMVDSRGNELAVYQSQLWRECLGRSFGLLESVNLAMSSLPIAVMQQSNSGRVRLFTHNLPGQHFGEAFGRLVNSSGHGANTVFSATFEDPSGNYNVNTLDDPKANQILAGVCANIAGALRGRGVGVQGLDVFVAHSDSRENPIEIASQGLPVRVIPTAFRTVNAGAAVIYSGY